MDRILWVSGCDQKKVVAETKPEKRVASVRRVFQTRAPMLLDGYESYYTDPSSD